MKYDIYITKKAQEDIIRVADYIEFTLLNPQASDALLDEAEKNISSLSQFPERNSLADDSVLSSWGIRFIRVKNYLAFYTVNEMEKRVYIIRFLYAKRNWGNILKPGFSIE